MVGGNIEMVYNNFVVGNCGQKWGEVRSKVDNPLKNKNIKI